jgi:hypothetical protein
MPRNATLGSRLDLVAGAIAAAAFLIAVQIYGLIAQDGAMTVGLPNPKDTLLDFKDDPWAASTGFISIPSARALASRPRWDSTANAPSIAPPDQAISLAIVGLPVDLENSMLKDNRADTYCLARQSATEQSTALCGRKSSEYTLLRSSKEFDLCGFTGDCWHSTAAAILASGTAIDERLFSFRALAAVPFKDGTGHRLDVDDESDESAASDSQDSDASQNDDNSDEQRLVYPVLPTLYNSTSDVQKLMDFSMSSDRSGSQVRAEEKRRSAYGRLPRGALPLVETYQGEGECCSFKDPAPSLVNDNVLLRTGRRPGGPIYAVNVFSRVENKQICAAAKRTAPCVLTNLVAQEKALQSILADAQRNAGMQPGATGSGRPHIAAILIIAGGPLTDKPCDNTATAQYISQLRKLGIYTFVPAGNDGEASKVRFPGCASDAVTVGALNRDGKISAFSNGRATAMVKLYADGDTLVLPIRALPIPGLACMQPEKFTAIVEGYEKILARLGYYQGTPAGALDEQTNAAVLRFQNATAGLRKSGRLDAATLQALEARANKLHVDDSEFTPISSNIKAADFADLAEYKQYLCKDGRKDAFYQAQFVAGTLVSASIAAGQFLQLVDQHKDMSTSDVFNSVMHGVATNRTKELDVAAASTYIHSLQSPTRPDHH